MLDKCPTHYLRPAAIVAVMFLSAMTVTVLASSGVGSAHTNCSMCSLACFEQSPANAQCASAPQEHFNTKPTQVALRDCLAMNISCAAAAWKVLDLPPPTR